MGSFAMSDRETMAVSCIQFSRFTFVSKIRTYVLLYHKDLPLLVPRFPQSWGRLAFPSVEQAGTPVLTGRAEEWGTSATMMTRTSGYAVAGITPINDMAGMRCAPQRPPDARGVRRRFLHLRAWSLATATPPQDTETTAARQSVRTSHWDLWAYHRGAFPQS